MSLLIDKILGVLLVPSGFAVAVGLCAGIFAVFGWRVMARTLVTFALLMLWALSTQFVAQLLIASLERQYPPSRATDMPKAPVAIILGGTMRLASPPARPEADLNDSADRIWFAAELYRAGKVPLIVVSGGNLPWEDGGKSEAESVAALLEQWGVPRTAIVVEGKSRNTWENAIETKKVLSALGISSGLLVTSGFHMPRAYAIFRKVGIDVTPAPTDIRAAPPYFRSILDLLPEKEAPQMSADALREWVGFYVYRARDWL